MAHMIVRVRAYLVVPALTIGASALALYVAAAPRTLHAVKVWGGPTGRSPSVIRIECLRQETGVIDRVRLDALRIDVAGRILEASCGDDGNTDVVLPQGLPERVSVRVTRHDQTLAEGVADVPALIWMASSRTTDARVPGGGALQARVYVPGGQLPLERWARVRVVLPAALLDDPSLRIEAEGAEVGPRARVGNALEVSLRATFVTARLTIERPQADPGARREAWEGALPIAGGSLSFDDVQVAQGKVSGVLRSPMRERTAYVRLHDDRGRVAAASFELRDDGNGGSVGEFSLDAGSPPQGDARVVASTEASASGSSAVSYPIGKGVLDGVVTPDALWVEGMTSVIARDRKRTSRAFWAGGLLIALGSVLEVLLLFLRQREASRAFDAHVREATDDALEGQKLEREGGPAKLLLAVFAVLFGFAIVGVVLLLRMG